MAVAALETRRLDRQRTRSAGRRSEASGASGETAGYGTTPSLISGLRAGYPPMYSPGGVYGWGPPPAVRVDRSRGQRPGRGRRGYQRSDAQIRGDDP
jgi:hypothetical protein